MGIGTSSPAFTLDVFGSAAVSENLIVTSLVSTSDVNISSLTVGLGGGSVPTNTAVGKNALINANSSSYNNTAVGHNALASQGSGGDSTAVGYYALANNTTGSDGNTAVGAWATWHNLTGSYNTAVGSGALSFNTTGSNNTALGLQALGRNNGSSNIAIGFRSGYYQAGGPYLTNAQRSIYIGTEARGYDDNDFNSIVIGNGAVGAGVNTTVIGGSGMTDIYFGSMAGLANIHAGNISGSKLFLGSSVVPGCIVVGDSDGNGAT